MLHIKSHIIFIFFSTDTLYKSLPNNSSLYSSSRKKGSLLTCPTTYIAIVLPLNLTYVYLVLHRYIAIVFPIKAHILCTKRRVLVVIICIWLFSGLCSTPTTVFNRVLQISETPPLDFCITQFHTNRSQHEIYNRIFKYTESVLFYLGPLVIQVVCYTVIGKRLFVGVEKLHRNSGGISSATRPNGRGPRVLNEAIRARKGVVKMLMASVAIYFFSYSPHQILLIYNTFSSAGFDKTRVFHVLTITLGYINSAANPVLYCVFSDNFRSKFKLIFHRLSGCKSFCCHDNTTLSGPITLQSYTEYSTLVRKNTQNHNINSAVAL